MESVTQDVMFMAYVEAFSQTAPTRQRNFRD